MATPVSDFDVSGDTITKYNGKDEEVLIPRYINEVEIKKLGNGAFFNCTSLEKVAMPKVTTIGNYAFSDCMNLEKVEMPKVTSVGNSAFSNCKSLVEVEMAKVITIGYGAFFNCTSLEKVAMPKVNTIEYGAFYNCTSLEKIEMPKVTSIGELTFFGCISLMEIVFGTTNPPTFGDNVFANGGNGKVWNIKVPAGSEIAYKNVLNTNSILVGTEKPKINDILWNDIN